MDKQLEKVLVEGNLQDIKVTLACITSQGDLKMNTMDLYEYIDTFGYVDDLGEQAVDILNVEKNLGHGITFVDANIFGYTYSNDIKFYSLINACKVLSECRGTNERRMVLDYLTCVVSLCTNVSVKEVKNRLAFKNRETLINFLKDHKLDVSSDSKAYKYIDFERWADDFIKYDYIVSTNGYIFS